MLKRLVVAVCAVFLAAAATAQTIGSYVLWPDIAIDQADIIIGPPPDPSKTYINLTNPATENATIRMAAFRIVPPANVPCPDSVKIKFFRRFGDVLTFLAERGPFSVNGTITKVTLPTPVDVQAGDVIGITLLRDCLAGVPQVAPIGQKMTTEGTAAIRADVSSGSYSIHGNDVGLPRVRLIPAVALSVFGSSEIDAEVRSQVIVAVGSAPGAGGSSFKTDIQMAHVPLPEFIFNAPLRGDTAFGRLVYHPEGTSGTPQDQSVPFKLLRGEHVALLNFVGGLGIVGKGSIDIYTTVGFEPPLANARVYEDSAGSTKGLTLDAVTLDRALTEDSVLFAPADPVRYRMNIGVRTLDRPTSLGFVIFRANGTQRTETVTIDYPANFYTQNEAGQLLGSPLQPGDIVVVRAGNAPAFVYGSIVDNVSQDPSVQFASTLK